MSASLDSNLILKISNALHFNFFQYYSAEVAAEMKGAAGGRMIALLCQKPAKCVFFFDI